MAIASGKGGVGKTNVVAGLAMALAQMGQRVVVLDADFGLANLDILLGLSPEYTLEHVLRGEKLMEEILLDGPFGIRIIPASSGIQELTRLDAAAEMRLVQGLQRISAGSDWLLIDTAAGIHDSVIKLLMAAQEVLLVTTPEPTALVDVYAMVKVVHLRDPHKPLWLLVNNAQSAGGGRGDHRPAAGGHPPLPEPGAERPGHAPGRPLHPAGGAPAALRGGAVPAFAGGPGAGLCGATIAGQDTLTKGRICCILERP